MRLAIALTVLMATAALASVVVNQPIDLSQAIAQSSHVVRARLQGGKGTPSDAYVFVVEHVVKGQGPRAEQSIRVWRHEEALRYTMSRALEEARAEAKKKGGAIPTRPPYSAAMPRLATPPSTELVVGKSYCLLLTGAPESPNPAAPNYAFAIADGHIAAPCPAIPATPPQDATRATSHRVVLAGLPVFSDSACRARREGLTAVGLDAPVTVLPTTRTHFAKGQRVSWQWNAGFIVQTSWYKDPTSHRCLKAWDSSMEFVGGVVP